MFPKDIREIIAQHLIELYSVVYEFETFSRKGFTTCIMDVFGGNSKDGVDVGEYSYIARLLEESGLLDLKEADIKSKSIREKMRPGPTPISTDKLIRKLKEKDWDQVDIERLLVQLKEASDDFKLMMRRMRQFRAGARLHYIAAQLLELGNGSVVRKGEVSIPPHITAMIEEVTEVLKNDENDTWNSLVKIQNNQLKGGKRLAKLQQLAAKRISGGEIDEDDLKELIELLAEKRTKEEAMAMIEGAAIGLGRLPLLQQLAAEKNRTGKVNKEELKKLLKLLKDERTEKEAMDMIEGAAIGLGRLPLLQQLAAEKNRTGEVNKKELKKLLNLLGKDRTEKEAMAMIEGVALLQDDSGERLSLLSQFASLYNKAGGKEGEGRATIESDSRLNKLVPLMGKGATRETAINAIVKLANRCNETFWRRYNELKNYREDFPEDIVDVY